MGGTITINEYIIKYSELLKPNGKALDVRCGHGENSYFLKAQSMSVTSFDDRKEVKPFCDNIGVQMTICNVMDFEYQPRLYDAVICIDILQCISKYDQRLIIPKIADSVNMNGYLFIETANNYNVSQKSISSDDIDDIVSSLGFIKIAKEQHKEQVDDDSYKKTTCHIYKRIKYVSAKDHCVVGQHDLIIDDNTYVTSDIHIYKPGSDNINAVIKSINDTVDTDDTITILGDVAYKKDSDLNRHTGTLIKSINCKNKYLVIGNHDVLPIDNYLRYGFSGVYDKIITKDYVFTHFPENIEPGKINIHGHSHGCREYWDMSPERHIDAYWKMNGHKPQTIKWYLDKYRRGFYNGKMVIKEKPVFIPRINYQPRILTLEENKLIGDDIMNNHDILEEGKIGDKLSSVGHHVFNGLSDAGGAVIRIPKHVRGYFAENIAQHYKYQQLCWESNLKYAVDKKAVDRIIEFTDKRVHQDDDIIEKSQSWPTDIGLVVKIEAQKDKKWANDLHKRAKSKLNKMAVNDSGLAHTVASGMSSTIRNINNGSIASYDRIYKKYQSNMRDEVNNAKTATYLKMLKSLVRANISVYTILAGHCENPRLIKSDSRRDASDTMADTIHEHINVLKNEIIPKIDEKLKTMGVIPTTESGYYYESTQPDLHILLEYYNGKQPELIRCEKLLQEIIDIVKKAYANGNLSSCDITNMKQNKEIEKILYKMFDIKISIYWTSLLNPNAMTISALSLKSSIIIVDDGLIWDNEFSASELMAFILHETGHTISKTVYNKIIRPITLEYKILNMLKIGVTNSKASFDNILMIISGILSQSAVLNPAMMAKLSNVEDNLIRKYIPFYYNDYVPFIRKLNNNPQIRTFMKFINILAMPYDIKYTLNHPIKTVIDKLILHTFAYREEQIADSLATSYGYGPSLISALKKMSDNYSEYSSFETAIADMYQIMTLSLFEEHPSTHQRILSQIKSLQNDLNNGSLSPAVKKQLMADLKDLEKIESTYMKSTGEEKLVMTTAIRNAVKSITGEVDVRASLLNIENSKARF